MKKRRFFKIICCFCLLLCSTFFLTACTGGGSGGSGSSSGYDSDNPPKPDPDKQPPSSGDDSDIDIDDDGNIGGNGQVADFSDYFYGYMGMIKGNDDFEVQDEATGSKVKFNALLDRQFDVLAQDILYRLAYVYGDRSDSSSFKLTVNNSVTYKYNNNEAIVDINKLLSSNVKNEDVSDLISININDINDYQKSIMIADNGANYLFDSSILDLSKAIQGKNMSITKKGSNKTLDANNSVSDKKWKWYIENDSDFINYANFANTSRVNSFKMALAQIVTGNTVTGEYTKENYDKLISSMDYLGYLKSSFIYKINNIEHNKLVDFINNYIIGTELITIDNGYFKDINDKYNGLINDDTIVEIDNSTVFNSNISNDSARLYKGYSVVVPAIVNQALNNTFESTKTSLYPYYARSSSKNGDFETRKIFNSSGEVVEEMTTTGPITLDKIILKPKANSQPVALQLQIATARKLNNGEQSDDINDLGCYAHDIVVELEVNITYKATYYTNDNGVQVAHPYILNMPTYVPDGEDSGVLTIDSKGYVPTYIDTNDPNFDPIKVTFDPNNPHAKDPYSEQFRKPYDTNGEILPFNYVFSIYNKYTDDTPKMGAYNGPSDASSMTLFNNGYKSDDSSVYLDAGENYIQFTFNIKSVKKYSGDNSSQLVDASEYKNDVVFDISLMPFTF
ncbi:MAG: hypothetical protein SPF07_03370 [Eubacteriales bacterium]|nr:hypothetical protein [Eubacteriales bacterium]